MSSSEDEDVLALVNLANLQRVRVRRYWIHPVWLNNKQNRFYKIMEDLHYYPDRFQEVYKMSPQCFNIIMSKVKNALQKRHTNWRECICPEERFLITLRYFADGCSFKSLSTYFLRGKSTIRQIVYDTCQVLWYTLQPEYMPIPTTEKWVEVAERFHGLWNLPNCIGSLDGKHIRIQAPPNSGSAYINYKGYFSIVLMALVDADGLFLTIDVGDYGRNSDGRALQVSALGQAIQHEDLNLPEPSPLPGETRPVPYYFVADEAFPLKKNIMKPYSRIQLTNAKREFNNRLSRGRKSVECVFGMTRTKFHALSTPLSCDPAKADAIIQAMCILHNIIRKYDGIFTQPYIQNTLVGTRIVSQSQDTAENIREYLTNYFVNRARISYQGRHNIT